ncbi:MAG: hypothetical protein JOZ75_11730 [Candidatus Dormibacteraeota bacterium]|nr:hypothetical protein [Candidatus Dormibacteraeota bacterium]
MLAGLAVAGCSSPADSSSANESAAQAGLTGAPGTPAPRSGAAIAFDPATQQVVMFGGLGAHGALGDTWIWSGTGWTRPMLRLSPHSQLGASMVYDARLGALVLIGGDADAPVGPSERANLAATWEWTATGWQRRDTPHIPTAYGPIAYDAASGRIVMVTTQGETHFRPCSTETWTFDGQDWQRAQTTSPLPATLAALVNEPKTGHVIAVLAPRPAVVPGGFMTTSCAPGSFAARELPTSSTWRWTGSTWTEVGAGTEPGGAQLASAPDGTFVQLNSVSGASMVLAGNDDRLWSWNGAAWSLSPRPAYAPPSQGDNQQVSVDRAHHIVLVGGLTGPNVPVTSGTWIWDGSQWHAWTGPAPETTTPSPAVFTPPSKT